MASMSRSVKGSPHRERHRETRGPARIDAPTPSTHARDLGHLGLVVAPMVRNKEAVDDKQVNWFLLLGPGDLGLGGAVLDKQVMDSAECA